MPAGEDRHDDHDGAGPAGPGAASSQPKIAWRLMPPAPANDNERGFGSIARAFLARHVYWLVSTILLAIVSLTLLIAWP